MQTVSLISHLIVDLDNTLYDWFDFWYASFQRMIQRLSLDSGIPVDKLLIEIKEIHQKHKTAEYAFLIQEIPSLRLKDPNENLSSKYKRAIQEYENTQKRTLRCYPAVKPTLEILKNRGCVVAAYTEGMSFYSCRRIRRLQLDGLIDYLYAPPDHKLSNTERNTRTDGSDFRALESTTHRIIPTDVVGKPNSQFLLKIIDEIQASAATTIYVGDDLTRDILMAQQANVKDVWAKYGTRVEKEKYELLQAVRFWSSADDERNSQFNEVKVEPTYVLENSFADLLNLFDFGRA